MQLIQYKTMRNKETDLSVLVTEKEFEYGEDIRLLCTPHSIVRFMEDILRISDETEEHLYMMCFNSAMKPIGFFHISSGTVNSTLASPREIFMKALLNTAVSIVLLHNHPSGSNINPSQDDIRCSKRLCAAGSLIGIHLTDFIIVGDNYSYTSFKEQDLL